MTLMLLMNLGFAGGAGVVAAPDVQANIFVIVGDLPHTVIVPALDRQTS
jgi:hypothetical protein